MDSQEGSVVSGGGSKRKHKSLLNASQERFSRLAGEHTRQFSDVCSSSAVHGQGFMLFRGRLFASARSRGATNAPTASEQALNAPESS